MTSSKELNNKTVDPKAGQVHGQGSTILEAMTGEKTVNASQLFDRKGTSRLAVVTIFSLSLILAAAVAWSSQMPIAEISVSSGEVMPSESVQFIQHLEGGIVSRLHVSEGQYVKQGEVLVELAPDIAWAELEQLKTRLAAVDLRTSFLTSAIQGRALPKEIEDSPYRRLVVAQTQALSAMRESIDSQASVLNQQVNERLAELETLKSQMTTLDKQIVLTRERVSGLTKLVNKGHFPRMRLIEDERDLARLIGERATLLKDAERLQERIRESEFRIAELNSKFQSELATELNELTSEAAELRLTINRANDRVRRLKIVAPVAGRVQGMETKTIGGVVGPGDTIMNIIPEDAWPHVEARISTRDIGYVSAGQEAIIKVQTYDYTRFGVLKGKVRQVSASTFTNEEGEPFYKAYIDLENKYVGTDETRTVTPGMTVLADIITGEKTLLAYLTSPVIRSFDAAFHER